MGEGLKGLGNVPRLAGVHPIYLMRQLIHFKEGTRKGPDAALMAKPVAELTERDMIDLVAYAASLDPEFKQALQRLIGKSPIPSIRFRLNPVPWHAVAGAGHAQFSHQPEILVPALVMAGQFVLVQGSPRDRVWSRDEGVLDAGGPPERIRCGQTR